MRSGRPVSYTHLVVPTLYQDDPQWADRPYGSRTVGGAGAAPLCLAMVRIEATGDASMGPVEVASLSQSSGYADTVEATGLLTDGAAQLGLASREDVYKRQTNDLHCTCWPAEAAATRP